MRNYLQACLLLTLVSCHQGPDHAPTMAANAANQGQTSQKKQPQASNIVFQSDDKGDHWQDISAGLPKDLLVMRVLAGKNDEIYLGAEHGVFRYNPPPAMDTWTNEFPLKDQVVGIFSGPSGMYASWVESGFFKNLPGKESDWMPMKSSSDKQYVWSAVETPEGAVVITNESGIFKTDDEGKTWKQVLQDESPFRLHIENGILYGICSGGILRSTDGGDHWDWMLEDDGSFKSIHWLDGTLVALIRKGDRWTIRFLSASNLDKKWQHLAAGLSGMRTITDFEQVDETLYCSHEGGVSRSDDRGKTWTLLLPAPADNLIFRIAVSGKKIFVVKATGC